MGELVPWRLIELPKLNATSGFITPIQATDEIPFAVKRVFYLYDVPSGESRGAHAHKECHQLLVAATGAFEVELTDGKRKERVLLNQPNIGLHIPPMIWASEVNFSGSSICLVLASHEYQEEDYIRDYQHYQGLIP
jgi:uncharacterized RmlC-like cupin family protein